MISLSKEARKMVTTVLVGGGIVLGTVGCSEASKPILATDTVPAASATMVNPTQEATKTATATKKATLAPTEIVINQEDLHRVPSSYAELQAHPENYTQVPDPLSDPENWNKWFKLYQESLGPTSQREANLYLDTMGQFSDEGWQLDMQFSNPRPITGQPDFFFFEHDGVKYPAYALGVGSPSGHDHAGMGTFIVILYVRDSFGHTNNEIMESIAKGEAPFFYNIVREDGNGIVFPDIVKQGVAAGLDGKMTGDRVWIGFGEIDSGPLTPPKK
jgi:hypothetical protein